MQAPYGSTELNYDPYQISMVNAAITFGNPNHMAKTRVKPINFPNQKCV